MRTFLFSFLIFFVFTVCNKSTYAQNAPVEDSSQFHPYFGVSINFSGFWGDNGYGFEFGCNYKFVFSGFEYGAYGIVLTSNPSGTPFIQPVGYVPPDYLLPPPEHYFGFHAGIVLKEKYWLGIDLLYSWAKIEHTTYDSLQGYSYFNNRKTFFNIGPDLRLNIFDHLTLNFSYTIRRGIKLGMAYTL